MLIPIENFADVVAHLPLFTDDIYNKRRLHSALAADAADQVEEQLAA
jgi:hypothetical protein